jgi:hypothetical protein
MEYVTSKRSREKVAVQKYINTSLENEDDFIFKSEKELGRGVQGRVYKILPTKPLHKGPSAIAYKISKLDPDQVKHHKRPFAKSNIKKAYFNELVSTLLINELITQQICPNFTLNYFYQFTDVCYKRKGNSLCLLQYNEYIPDGTFEKWAEEQHSIQLWYNAFFQIFAALHAIDTHFGMVHTDLHAQNIMIKKVEPGGYWKYKINGLNYYVPNMGYVFLVFDFGYSWIPGKMKVDWYHSEFSTARQKIITNDMNQLKYVIENSDNNEELQDLVKSIDYYRNKSRYIKSIGDIITIEFYGLIGARKNSGKNTCKQKPWRCYNKKKGLSGSLIETYDLDKKLNKSNIPKELHYLVL